MNIRNMTVRAKLAIAFGTLAVMIALVAGMAVKSLNDANARFANFVQGINARLLLSYEIRTAVDRRAIGARDLLNAVTHQDRDSITEEITKAHHEVQTRMAKLTKMASGTGVSTQARNLIAKMSEIEAQYSPVALKIVELAYQGKHDEAVTEMNAECRPLLAALIHAARNYRDYTSKHSEELVAQAAFDYSMQRNLLFLGCLMAFIAAILSGALITRSITRALGTEPVQLREVAQRVARGNLSVVTGASNAPSGSVLASLAQMQICLAQIIDQVRSSSDSIAIGTSQIATGNANLSLRTEEQAGNLRRTTSSIEQLSGTVKTSTEVMRQANHLASQASEAARASSEKVGQVVETMQNISQSSRKIAEIIGIIDGIAFQTNILALNAAVEAARAGEQGRGFAVVASEVRTLAQRSARAANEIKELICVSIEKVEAGTKQVDEAGASMQGMVTQAQRVSQMFNELTKATVEQSQSISQVGDALQQLDHVTKRNGALVEETANAAENLRHQADQLTHAMNQFKLDSLVPKPSHP